MEGEARVVKEERARKEPGAELEGRRSQTKPEGWKDKAKPEEWNPMVETARRLTKVDPER